MEHIYYMPFRMIPSTYYISILICDHITIKKTGHNAPLLSNMVRFFFLYVFNPLSCKGGNHEITPHSNRRELHPLRQFFRIIPTEAGDNCCLTTGPLTYILYRIFPQNRNILRFFIWIPMFFIPLTSVV